MEVRYRIRLLFLLVFLHQTAFSQVPPKREFRGAWIATVVNLDWPPPNLRGAHPDSQRVNLTKLLDGLKTTGINAIVFQVRPECDALYPSLLEPWSYWLTGQQGKAPVDPFDPLTFVLLQAHARGMEVHAWFNPYRAARQVGSYAVASNHISATRPDLTRDYPIYTTVLGVRKLTGHLRVLNPGLPEVRVYVTSVIMDVVRRFEIDGVHFDDYFYPYPTTDSLNRPVPFPDSDTYYQNNPKGLSLSDWRRDNVNSLIKMISDSLKAVKPNVKFGISPFGIWRSGVPTGIAGLSAYDEIYCDALAWLGGRYIDYLTPQLYWPFGGGQDYAKLMPWWADQTSSNSRHLYPGQAAYRIKDSNWGSSELPSQIRLNRAYAPKTQGSVFFRAAYGVNDNPKGFADSLKNDLYKYPALRPIMSWKETVPPNPPTNLTITKFPSSAMISWIPPSPASDGEAASQFVVYRSSSLPIPFSDPRAILSVQTTIGYAETSLPSAGVTYYYAVTALDRLQNESTAGNIMGLTSTGVVGIEAPVLPVAAFRLNQNFPNPFNPSTIISFRIPTEQRVTLRVYDMLGREVAVLLDGIVGAGERQVQFDGHNLPSGVYIYRLVSGNFVESRKMQLVR